MVNSFPIQNNFSLGKCEVCVQFIARFLSTEQRATGGVRTGCNREVLSRTGFLQTVFQTVSSKLRLKTYYLSKRIIKFGLLSDIWRVSTNDKEACMKDDEEIRN